MLLWVIIILLVLILIDVVRLHRKVDRLYDFLNPKVPPSVEEIENMLTAKNDSLE
ncbi:hypothetical protein [Mesobacillus jeotgali]|jgi:hypothetical protein|uniref:Uncharacterized protein n=1 Tax=Mesobacillus jeotgali TaxID=129985 RepID=A0ABY9VM52_9BACI|nr:hypothetical protein [Mesobacillus jeotgali]WNF25047.1 hypothetical protein RH061_11395 [Mesobacillus jeotgali]